MSAPQSRSQLASIATIMSVTAVVGLNDVYEKVHTLIGRATSEGKPLFVGLCGVPGSGKSTVSSALLSRFGKEIAVVPMDGYHYSRAKLVTFPDPDEAFRRRGSPWTFDSAAFARDVALLKQRRVFRFPSFDHAIKDPTPAEILVDCGSESPTKVVVFEGLYVFLESDAGFSAVSRLLDEKWYVETDLETALYRAAMRHVRAGIEPDLEHAMRRVDQNDRINALLVQDECRRSASWRFQLAPSSNG